MMSNLKILGAGVSKIIVVVKPFAPTRAEMGVAVPTYRSRPPAGLHKISRLLLLPFPRYCVFRALVLSHSQIPTRVHHMFLAYSVY